MNEVELFYLFIIIIMKRSVSVSKSENFFIQINVIEILLNGSHILYN